MSQAGCEVVGRLPNGAVSGWELRTQPRPEVKKVQRVARLCEDEVATLGNHDSALEPAQAADSHPCRAGHGNMLITIPVHGPHDQHQQHQQGWI